MINFPEIQFKKKENLVILFFFTMMFFFFNIYSTKVLLSILLIIIIITNYNTFKKNVKENIIQKDKKLSINYNIRIEENLQKLRKYKKRSPQNYKEGMYYWIHFLKMLDTLEEDELYNYNQYFDRAYEYLKKSTNIFQALGVESYDRKYIDGLKYNDFTNTKELSTISKISSELFDEGYKLLYNLSLKLNKKWKENPHVFNKEIVLDFPTPYDKDLHQIDFYG